MLAPGKIDAGTALLIPISFSSDDDAPVDPDTVIFRLMSPCRRQYSYTYGTDAELTKPSVGTYQMEIPASVINQGGRWFYRWQTTGTGTSTAREGNFVVQYSPFLDEPSGDYAL